MNEKRRRNLCHGCRRVLNTENAYWLVSTPTDSCGCARIAPMSWRHARTQLSC